MSKLEESKTPPLREVSDGGCSLNTPPDPASSAGQALRSDSPQGENFKEQSKMNRNLPLL